MIVVRHCAAAVTSIVEINMFICITIAKM